MKKESNSGISFFQRYLTVTCQTSIWGSCRNFYSAASSYMDYDLSNDDEG